MIINIFKETIIRAKIVCNSVGSGGGEWEGDDTAGAVGDVEEGSGRFSRWRGGRWRETGCFFCKGRRILPLRSCPIRQQGTHTHTLRRQPLSRPYTGKTKVQR